MALLSKIMPEFWARPEKDEEGPGMLFNYRRMWWLTVAGTLLVSLLPLCVMMFINFVEYRRVLRTETIAPMERLVSNTARSVSFFLEERKSALKYIVLENRFQEISDIHRLGVIMRNLKGAFGGFIDMGVIDSDGVQRVYTGPFALEGKNYRDQDWFSEVAVKGEYVSEVFTGFRDFPHFVIAVKREVPPDKFYILRATIDTQAFQELTLSLNMRDADAFLVSQSGVFQTKSRFYGGALEQFWYGSLPDSSGTEILEVKDPAGKPLFVGYCAVENTPFVFVLINKQKDFHQGWAGLGGKLMGFFAASVLLILVVVLTVCTFLVERIYEADRRRNIILHKAEYTNKLASLGRLAAGVAHEINNPLAIINEKAGLLTDMIEMAPEFPHRERAVGIMDSILATVERCSAITHRLLGFARHIDVRTEVIALDALLREVLGFLEKESEYREIKVDLTVEPDLPNIESDRGQLQQVFLNIINNAFAAVEDGGRIKISLERAGMDKVAVQIADNGCGIPRENLKLVFEPFFSTKGRKGTGLGLSITYGIVRKLGGNIEVDSDEGVGTTFTVTLPLKRTT